MSYIINNSLFKLGGLGRKLFAWILICAWLPLIGSGIYQYVESGKIIEKQQHKLLTNILKGQQQALGRFFVDTVNTLSAESDTSYILQQLIRYKVAQSNKPLDEFVKSFKWALISDEYGADLRAYVNAFNYYDAYLIDMEGNIHFTVRNNSDLGRNVYSDDYKYEGIRHALNETKATGNWQFSDLVRYGPAKNKILGFITQIIVDENGDKSGYLMVSLSFENLINGILNQADLGPGGRMYMVGSDGLLRADPTLSGNELLLENREAAPIISAWRGSLSKDSRQDGRLDDNYVEYYKRADGVAVIGQLLPVSIANHGFAIIAETSQDHAFLLKNHLAVISIYSSLISFLVICIVAIILLKRIVNPIDSLTETAKKIALGVLTSRIGTYKDKELIELSGALERIQHSFLQVSDICLRTKKGIYGQKLIALSDEDEITNNINSMVDQFKSVVSKSQEIAAGKYEVNIVPQSEHDELAFAVNNMTEALRVITSENDKKRWQEECRSKLFDIMRGHMETDIFSKNIIRFLCKSLDACVGVFYVCEGESITLKGSYAFMFRKNPNYTFQFGEGYVGQSALEKEMVIIEDLPNDYMRLTSGTGDLPARCLVLLPLVHNDKVFGVIELAFRESVEDKHLSFLMSISENIAVSLDSNLTRSDLAVSLDSVQKQTLALEQQKQFLATANTDLEEQANLLLTSEKILKEQQDTLQSSNTKLHSQTEELRASEEALQSQQEELRATNEQLESKAEELTQQKEFIEDQNAELEMAADELQRRSADIEQASRYKSEFLANMSHELRTPLNSILILSDSLSKNRRGNLLEKDTEALKIINQGGKELLELINDILDLAKVESGKLELLVEDVDINDSLQNILNLFVAIAEEKSIELLLEVDAGTPGVIVTDNQRLKQILKNLVSNAIKFTKEGHVKISTRKASEDDTEKHLLKGTHLVVEVEDTGIGVAHSKQDLIFEAFKQADGATNREFGGTGLGLSITKAILHELQGTIHLESVEGEGSKFTIFLPVEMSKGLASNLENSDSPRQTKPAERVLEVKDSGEGVCFSGQCLNDDRAGVSESDSVILIIEDDIPVAKVIAEHIQSLGYKYIQTDNARSGVLLAEKYQPSAILLDVMLPDMNGLDALEILKFNIKTRSIPVHVMSSANHSVSAKQLGAKSFTLKPMYDGVIDDLLSPLGLPTTKVEKHVLLVEDNDVNRKAVISTIENSNITIKGVRTAAEAITALKEMHFDCMILDLGLPDMSGQELLGVLERSTDINTPPVIIYTGRELTKVEYNELSKQSKQILIKTADSSERLLDEVSLFLHLVNDELSVDQSTILKRIHDLAPVLKGKRVLLVDDDMRNCFALSGEFRDLELHVDIAENGKSAIEKLEDTPNFDIILMDIMMPVMDGYEAIKLIREREAYKTIPILALTANALPKDRQKCIDAGANDYLSKPLDIDQLISMMRVWLYDGRAD